MRHVIVGTAGHIDHGKSALVQALTGIDPDRLKEEKLRGITIDLGFAHMDLGDVQVGFVDVPGHEKFVRNMLAGVGGIDIVLLVVAADESIMPQTQEHFDICRLLGIPSGIVVITKTDTVEEELVDLVREEIQETVRGSFLDGAEIIPVSSKTGEGIDQLKQALRTLAHSTVERPMGRLLRLPIDRAFSMRGFGTVVTGTLTSGIIEKDQEVELLPDGLMARVRGIQVYGRGSERAVAGQRTAVNLQGVDLSQVRRGMVLTVPRLFHATRILDVRLDLLQTARPLKNLSKLRFHQGTSEVMARVAFIGDDTLAPGGSAYAQLRLDYPMFCVHGDAFVVRQFSPAVTIGGGRIVAPHPTKHKTADRQILVKLKQLDSGTLAEKIPILISAHRSQAIDLKELNAQLGLAEKDLKLVCAELASSDTILMVPAPTALLMLPSTVASLESETVSTIADFHNQNPLQKGISREELRNKVYGRVPQEVFRFCLDRLVEKRKISLHEEIVSLHGREVQLSTEEEQLKEMIEERFRRTGYQPPSLSELADSIGTDPEEIRRILFWMLKQRILVRVSEDLAYLRSTLEEIKRRIRETFTPGTRFGVAEFKELFDLTRKHAIPLLEFLDRERFTRREGNDRVLL